MLADAKLIIPEYKIELLNKSKKLINTIENIDKNIEFKETKKIIKAKSDIKTDAKKSKKTKTVKKKAKKLRTLWYRRKKIA